MILQLEFSEILNICRNWPFCEFQLVSGCDVTKFLNLKPEESKSFARNHSVDIDNYGFLENHCILCQKV